MEKINITELLKNCPKGMELDCTMYDDIHFDGINNSGLFPITIRRPDTCKISLTKYGQYANADYAKCVIFPKGKTTWEGFVPPCQFKDGDVVTYKLRGSLVAFIYKEKTSTMLINSHFALYKGNMGFTIDSDIALKEEEIVFATEEEKQKLFNAIKANGYKWNTDEKKLEKLIKPKFKVGDKVRHKDDKTVIIITGIKDDCYFIQFYNIRKHNYQNEKFLFKDQDDYELILNKFDITKLKPFKSEVLIRNDKTQEWIPAFWGYKANNGKYVTTFGTCRYCIPYEGNENLLSTNNDCLEYYKTWEE